MSRPVFGKKSCQLQRPRVDRFMPPRESFADERRRGSWRLSTPDHTVNIWEAKYRKQKNYQKRLDEVFGLESITDGLASPYDKACSQPWPCAPRKKGCLSSVDSILDLPTYSYATFPEILDWSSHNMLVAALGENYHLFSWKTQSVMGQGYALCPILCCKFDPAGRRLLIGSSSRFLEIHDAALIKVMQSLLACQCFWDYFKHCSITAVDWSPTGNSFITGCSFGKVCYYDSRRGGMTKRKHLGGSPILTAKISPDARFVAVVLLNSALVYVLKWPSLETHSTMNSEWIVKTIAWHPWRSALLGVGVTTSNQETTIVMWDTPSSRLRDVKLGLGNHYILDVMLFSHRTGELVLSLWNADRAVTMTKTYGQLMVMSDPNTVVDQSGEGKNVLDRVRTMVFSPDGTKLATATTDEDLIIWNFLPEDKKSGDTKCRKFHSLPLYLDEVTYDYSFR